MKKNILVSKISEVVLITHGFLILSGLTILSDGLYSHSNSTCWHRGSSRDLSTCSGQRHTSCTF